MKFRSITVGAALVVGAMTVGLGGAHADPATPAPERQGVNYSLKVVDKSVVAKLAGGTFQVAADGKSYTILDEHNNAVVSLPTNISVGGVDVPVQPVIEESGKVLQLTPQPLAPEQVAAIGDKQVQVKPIASPQENQSALSDFATQFGIATAVGGFLGTALGVVVGAVTGCILGLPLLGVGCIPAAIAGASVGGIIGTIVTGGPALAITGLDLINTLSAAPNASKWAKHNN